MGVPKDCKCAEHFCCEARCHAKTIFRWRGDYDFTNHRTLSDFPYYRAALDTSQPAPTSMVWRIRYDLEDLDWLDWVINNNLTAQSGNEISASLAYQASMINGVNSYQVVAGMGPVRDGQMMGTLRSSYHYFDSTPLYNARFSGWNWSGEMLSYVDLPGGLSLPSPVVHGQQLPGEATFTADMPWALDIGCVRCGVSHNSITWPSQDLVSYVPATTAFADWFRADDDRVLQRERYRERCHGMDDGEQAASYWAGDSNDSRQAPPCVPELIMWHHDWRRVVDSLNDFSPPTTKTATYRGWARPVAENSQTFLHTHADGTDVMVLLGDRRWYTGSASAENAALTSAQLTALSDWLDLGGKTLIITHPAIFSDYQIESGDPGGLLAGIGCSLRIATPNASWINYDFSGSSNVEHWKATTDPLATNLPANYQRPKVIANVGSNSGYSVYHVDGGVALLNAERSDGVTVYETNPIISYETLASGSRVVLYGLARDYVNNVADPGISSATVEQTAKDIANNALNGL